MQAFNINIGILTWHYYRNFGSALQSFALQTIIERLGFNVRILNYRNPKFAKANCIKGFVRNLLSYLPAYFRNSWYLSTLGLNTIVFQRTYLKQTKLFYRKEDITKIIKDINLVVYGSDQIWAPNVFNSIYMGDYLPVGIKKISYAASIGIQSLSYDLTKEYYLRLKSFSSISVRESAGKNLLNSIGIIDVTVVLDPTLLVDVSTYAKMERKLAVRTNDFVFCYFLNCSHNYKNYVQKYANGHNLVVIGVRDNPSDRLWMNVLDGLGADQFLWLVHNANTVFTDSYHGSIFSILFHKNLYIFKRFADNNPISQNSRIRQLIYILSLQDRLVDSTNQISSQINESEIDYKYIDEVLAYHRQESITFLKNAIINNA